MPMWRVILAGAASASLLTIGAVTPALASSSPAADQQSAALPGLAQAPGLLGLPLGNLLNLAGGQSGADQGMSGSADPMSGANQGMSGQGMSGADQGMSGQADQGTSGQADSGSGNGLSGGLPGLSGLTSLIPGLGSAGGGDMQGSDPLGGVLSGLGL